LMRCHVTPRFLPPLRRPQIHFLPLLSSDYVPYSGAGATASHAPPFYPRSLARQSPHRHDDTRPSLFFFGAGSVLLPFEFSPRPLSRFKSGSPPHAFISHSRSTISADFFPPSRTSVFLLDNSFFFPDLGPHLWFLTFTGEERNELFLPPRFLRVFSSKPAVWRCFPRTVLPPPIFPFPPLTPRRVTSGFFFPALVKTRCTWRPPIPYGWSGPPCPPPSLFTFWFFSFSGCPPAKSSTLFLVRRFRD